MKLKIKHWLFVLIAVVSSSCSMDYLDLEPEFVENDIFGVWADTVRGQQNGYLVNELVFRENGTFVAGTKHYGVYITQNTNQLSAYSEYYGNYVLGSKNIYFASKQNTYWDSLTAAAPVITVKDEVLFESCTYKISNDTLSISYITYPADAPEVTTRKYIKAE